MGFEPTGLITIELSPPEDRVATIPAARGLYDRLVEQVQAIPGVQSAGLTGWLPLRAEAPPTPINLESEPVDGLCRLASVQSRAVRTTGG